MSQRLPAQPGAPRPDRWGEEAFMRELLGPHAADITFSRGHVYWEFPSREAMREFTLHNVPPMMMLKNALPPDDFEEAFGEIERLQEPFNRGAGDAISIETEYLVTIARPA